MSDITKARIEISGIANSLRAKGEKAEAARLEAVIADHMHRRPAARRVTAHSNKVTPAIKREVLHLAATTELHSSEIATRLGVNPGRVSEILNE